MGEFIGVIIILIIIFGGGITVVSCTQEAQEVACLRASAEIYEAKAEADRAEEYYQKLLRGKCYGRGN